MKHTLLVELLTEELPPKSLARLGSVFAAELAADLKQEGFLGSDGVVRSFSTPRRLAVQMFQVLEQAPDQSIEVQGPSVKAGLDAAGSPTGALLGFARKVGVDPAALERKDSAKGPVFVCRQVLAGARLESALALKVEAALKKLPIPRIMRWGDGDAQFVRPVHGLIMLHGRRVVPGTVLGLKSGNRTLGHRFLGDGEIVIAHAEEYADTLRQRGSVIASFEERRSVIAEALRQAASGLGASLVEHETLLDEVTALVEFPAVYAGEFDPGFLAVPQECLILSMQQHQKYFPLLDTEGRLLPRFLIVSNLRTADPGNIVIGNQRVLRARLSDARFFFDQDRKTRLEARLPRLEQVVYHNRLGSQLARVQRIRKLSGAIAALLNADEAQAQRAGYLAKADLTTDMVGEFPELQGVMGRYYALHDGEPAVVADAIEQHYRPRFANDSLPRDNVGCAVALADKLDTLVGIFGIGLAPTGDKDPYALRRAALGVLRILLERELPLDLMQLLQLAHGQFPRETLADSVEVDVYQFMLERLRHYLRAPGALPSGRTPGALPSGRGREFGVDEVEAVVSQNPTRIDRVLPRLVAVQAFRGLPEAQSLAAANKRIQNILRKAAKSPEVAGPPEEVVNPSLLQEAAEKSLFAATSRMAPVVSSLIQNGDYTDALCALAQVRQEVDSFFDQVMVMTDEPLLRDNRLALLRQLGRVMNQVADISKLASY